MSNTINFILNQKTVSSAEPKGKVLVDEIRKNFNLKGTVIACREGDCGACTVLVGELKNDQVLYRSITSCIFPIINIHCKHIVTIEGLKDHVHLELTPIQNAFKTFGASQCGYCTPGFIVSLIGFFVISKELTYDEAITAVDGNICRCTGYKSIERAIRFLIDTYALQIKSANDRIKVLIDLKFIPQYFSKIYQQLTEMNDKFMNSQIVDRNHTLVGGGTDLFVQSADELYVNSIHALNYDDPSDVIQLNQSFIELYPNCRIEDLKQSEILQKLIPNVSSFFSLFASTQIRNQGTVIGNIVNASPIGDVSNFLLALEAQLVIENSQTSRTVALKDFYLSYKKYDLKEGEHIKKIYFSQPTPCSYINFEKVSKRTYLDIASVTTSIHIVYDQEIIQHVACSAGGVAPIPLFLTKMSNFFKFKKLNATTIKEAVLIGLNEIQPISDIRGSSEYKKLLFQQLIYAHFLTCFPHVLKGEDFYEKRF